jgi:hypothetical protein
MHVGLAGRCTLGIGEARFVVASSVANQYKGSYALGWKLAQSPYRSEFAQAAEPLREHKPQFKEIANAIRSNHT